MKIKIDEKKLTSPLLKEMVKRIGRPARFEKPEALLECFCEYVEFQRQHPWEVFNQQRGKRSGSEFKGEQRQLLRVPCTLQGFIAFTGTGYRWEDFKRHYSKKSEQFSTVITRIENFVQADQLEGAIIGEFKENIVARLNGIKDGQDITAKAEVEWTGVRTKEEAKRYLARLNKE